ncbi:hypothetical protein P691DRAFT_608488, partial [Macrolepiota fuliginosa MF-IS2]
KLPPVQSIKHKGKMCDDLQDLWLALDDTYNSAEGKIINPLPLQNMREWPPFSTEEALNALHPTANSSPGRDHLNWGHLKTVLVHLQALTNVLTLSNYCIEFSTWPNHFKTSMSVIIPKPNKPDY